jgi:predicted nucleic acid-binding protein
VRLYLDTNVFIYAMETDYDQGMRARRCLHRIERGEIEAFTSELTLAEVLRGGNAPIRSGLFDSYAELLSSGTQLRVVPVSRDILIASARLELERKIDLPDAIHVATAIKNGCDAILTEDVRLPVPVGLKKMILADLIPIL